MTEPKNNVLTGIILIFAIFGLIALGVWTASRPSTGDVTGVLPGLGQSSVKVDVVNNTDQISLQTTKTDGTYIVTDNNEKGIDIDVQSKSPFKMTLPTSLNAPITITLGDNKTIEIVQKDGAEYSTGVKGNTVETTENAKLLDIIEKDPTLSTYVSTDNKKTIFYSYQKTEGEQKQWLFKNWILYNTQTNKRETVSYEMRNALVSIDALGNANVYFDDKTAIGNRTPDFSIPRPYILDKDAKKTDLMWTFNAVSHTLSVSFTALASSYPIALDPSVLKTDTVIATFSGKGICMSYSCGTPTVPDAPTIGTATQTGATTATVSFTAPARNGRATITTYTAYPSSGGGSGTLSQAGSGTINITGLTAGTAYTFTVKATNSVGLSAASSASNSVTPVGVPGAPTIGTATQTGATTATVAFTAPADNGGATITTYTAYPSSGGGSGTLSQAGSGTITVTGLSALTSYTFTVKATNSAGQSAASSASNSVTTPCGGTITFTYNGGSVTYGLVTGADGKCWMDRNLGATQVAVSSTDYLAYGSLFQWGRRADGHQLITWTSSTAGTAVNGSTATLADVPANSLFITNGASPYDWRVNQDGTLWANSSSTNNPCPASWHVPLQTEWAAWVTAASVTNSATAYSSTLKLSLGGYRDYSDASLLNQGSYGYYWSSSPYGTLAYYLYFYSGGVNPANYDYRAYGFSVRCVKD